MSTTQIIVGSAPGSTIADKAKLSGLRALRTFIQGVAAAFPASGVGGEILSVGYWEMFGVAVLTALLAAVASFLQNISTFLPEDPSQKDPPQ